MPCNDSSSSMTIRLDNNERIVRFDFAKITCGRRIDGATEYAHFCKGRGLQEVLQFRFNDVQQALKPKDDESQFILFLEWDALRCAIAGYLGVDIEGIDRERCKITSVTHDESGVEIAEVILPPKELPKILPCSLANNS